jgi:hypothetical protein
MVTTGNQNAACQIANFISTLSAPERLEFEECLKRVNQWMARGAPVEHWRDLRPAIGIAVNYLMRIPILSTPQMEALVVLDGEIGRASPDLHLVRFVWTA